MGMNQPFRITDGCPATPPEGDHARTLHANDTLDEKVFNAPSYPESDRKGPIPTSTLPSPLQRRL